MVGNRYYDSNELESSLRKRNRNEPQKLCKQLSRLTLCFYMFKLLHHAAHSRSTAHRHCRGFFLLVYDEALGCEEHTCY